MLIPCSLDHGATEIHRRDAGRTQCIPRPIPDALLPPSTITLDTQVSSSNQHHHHQNKRNTPGLPRPRHPNPNTGTLRQPQRQPLLAKRHILHHTRIIALPIRDVQPPQVVRHVEEHVLALRQALKPRRIVGEPVGAVGAGRVAQEDALHLVRAVVRQLRVVGHDVRVGGVAHQDELALREGLEDPVEEVLADCERCRDVGEVEGPGIEGAEGVGLVDEAAGMELVSCLWEKRREGGGPAYSM